MTNINHTPGPWIAEISEFANEQTGWINGFEGKPIVEYAGCGTHYASWPNPADLLLAAAAPELLEALETILEEYDVGLYRDQVQIQRAYAAIAKARGEQDHDHK